MYFFSADGVVLLILFLFNGWCRSYFNVNFLSADAAVCILFSFLTDGVVRILLSLIILWMVSSVMELICLWTVLSLFHFICQRMVSSVLSLIDGRCRPFSLQCLFGLPVESYVMYIPHYRLYPSLFWPSRLLIILYR